MMDLLSSVCFPLLLVAAALVLSSAAHDGDRCGVYFAPSTIPGAGFGMFAGRAFQPGEVVTPGDLVVAETDFAFHNGAIHYNSVPYIFNFYNWIGSSFYGMDSEALVTSGASFGIGSCPNSFIPLINIVDSESRIDSAGLHRSRDPGSGAFTVYHDRQGLAITSIPEGMELFLDYGDQYFEDRKKYGAMPKLRHYEKADFFLNKFANLKQYWSEVLRVPETTVHDVYNLITWIKNIWDSPVLNAIPENMIDVDEIAKEGTRFVHFNRSIRTIDWLKENGSCMDNLKPGKSTISQAGRGAFTKRPISKDETIAPVPLIHVPSRSLFDMYESTEAKFPHWLEAQRDLERGVFHKQLLLNYCFGHGKIDLLLCPYGVGTALVNHSKNQTNARIIWSKKSMSNPGWLDMAPEKWLFNQHAGLAFDLVATRDLSEGEEVFIDYGDAWQMAWDEHMATWLPPPNSQHYRADYELNDTPDLVIPTVEETSASDNHIHSLHCREIFRSMWGLEEDDPNGLHPCRATKRFELDGQILYNVEILDQVQDPKGNTCAEVVDEVLLGVPRGIFVYKDRPYTRDQTQPWTFRHEMQIPDSLVPSAWKQESSRFSTLQKTFGNYSDQTDSIPFKGVAPPVFPVTFWS